MIFKLKTSAAMPALNKPASKPKGTDVANGQLTGLAKSIVDKEAQPKPVAAIKPIDAPKVDASVNKNDASLALGKLNPDIKAQEMGGSGLGDLTSSTAPAKQRIDTNNNSPVKLGGLSGKLVTSPRPGISDIKDNIQLPVNDKPPATVLEGAPPIATINKPITPEPQRSETNTESDIKEAPPTTNVGLTDVPEGADTSFQNNIASARIALDKMLSEGTDPALRAEAEATLREAEAAGVKDTRKSQALGATGLSGAGGRLESDVRKLGKRETVTGMDEYDRATRQEETKRLQEGLGLQGDIQRAELERLAVERARKQLGTVQESDDGTITETAPDGSTRITRPNGDVITRRDNGTVTTHPDGTQDFVFDEAFQSAEPITVKSAEGRSIRAPVRADGQSGIRDTNAIQYTDASGNTYIQYRDNATGEVFLVQE